MTAATIHRVAFPGDYLPRQCGIATFTTDICEAVASEFFKCECIVGAVNDRPEGYDYPARIIRKLILPRRRSGVSRTRYYSGSRGISGHRDAADHFRF